MPPPSCQWWTHKRDARLAACAAEGMSRSQAAAVINAEFGTSYSRSAVSGRMDRLGLKAKPTGAPRPKPPRAPWGFFKKKHRPRPRAGPSVAVEARKPVRPQAPAAPVPLVKLQAHHCRAVVKEHGADGLAVFCGAEKMDGSSYCPTHHQAFHTRGSPPKPAGMILRAWLPNLRVRK